MRMPSRPKFRKAPIKGMSQLNRALPVPLYHQLKQILFDKIQRRQWQPGEPIPSESHLEKIYGVSRITVRQALAELVSEGYLERQQGRGTFVCQPKFMHDPAQRLALSDMMQQHGVKPGWRVLSATTTQATARVAETLSLASDKTVFRLERLRLANDEAIGYHLTYVPQAFADRIDKTYLELGDSLGYLQSNLDLTGSSSERTLEAIEADSSLAQHLNIDMAKPLLRIERTLFSPRGVALEFMQASYRGDRFKYHIAL